MKKKLIGYRLFGLMFTLFRLFPINKDKAFLIETHDDSDEGNIEVTAQAMFRYRQQMRFIRFTKKDSPKHFISFFIVKAYHMATAGTILLDNVFMPMAYTPISQKATVIQLWHGTGTIKKFGLDSDTGDVYRLAKRGNKRITWLIVNGERTKRQYASAFGLPEEKIRTLGLPRTDKLFDTDYMKKMRRAFFEEYRRKLTDPKKKRYVLYAPTFRDDEIDKPKLMLDVKRMLSALPEDVVLLLRFHPFVAEAFSKESSLKELDKKDKARVLDVSGYDGVTTLLAVADVLVTDYSSIIFEYALLKKPMVFYAYDFEKFKSHGRDFYEPYEEFVPGPIVYDEEGLIRELNATLSGENKQIARIEAFLEDNYRRIDGRAAERIAALALGRSDMRKKTRQDRKKGVK